MADVLFTLFPQEIKISFCFAVKISFCFI